MSPRDYYREMEAAKGRMEDAQLDRVHAAWHTALFTQMALAGKLPALATVLNGETTDAPVTTGKGKAPVQGTTKMATTVRMLASYYGQPVRMTH